MTNADKDSIDPFRTSFDERSRSQHLRKRREDIDILYNDNTAKFTGTNDLFIFLMKSCADQNLWEMCFYLKVGTCYSLTPKSFIEISTYAKEIGSLAFYYSICFLGVTSGIDVFKELKIAKNEQEAYIKKVTTDLYVDDIISRGWELNSFFRM